MTPPGRTYAGRTADQRRSDRRERLLEAALDLFGTEGYAQVPVERLCVTAGVSTRHFYEEFGGREQLLIALYEQINDEAVAAVTEAWEQAHSLPLAKRLDRLLRAYVSSTASDRRRARVMFVEVVGASAELEDRRLQLRANWVTFVDTGIQQAIERGEIEPGDYQLTLVAFAGAVNGLVHDAYVQGRASLDDVVTALVHLLLARVTMCTRATTPGH